jgi:DNA mismatch repair protein MutL
MSGQFPVFALDISLALESVDVNVHPTKREVRILDLEAVSEVLRTAVDSTLTEMKVEYEDTTLDEMIGRPTENRMTGETAGDTSAVIREPLSQVPFIEQTLLHEPVDESMGEPIDFLQGVFRIVGQIHDLYILLEFDDGLLFVDQHAAHERIIYERLKADMEKNKIAVQDLLQPIILNLNVEDYENIMKMKEPLSTIGYAIESFGGSDIAISTLPEVLGKRANEKDLISFVDRANDLDLNSARELFMDELIKLTACHSAIRSGQKLNTNEIREIITQLRGLKRKFNCCHGRPSMLKVYKKDLDRRFGRLGPEALARFRARHGMKE